MIEKLKLLAALYLMFGLGASGFCYVTMTWERRQGMTWHWTILSPFMFPFMVMRDLVRLVLDPDYDKP